MTITMIMLMMPKLTIKRLRVSPGNRKGRKNLAAVGVVASG